jgi:hypothetical protein
MAACDLLTTVRSDGWGWRAAAESAARHGRRPIAREEEDKVT